MISAPHRPFALSGYAAGLLALAALAAPAAAQDAHRPLGPFLEDAGWVALFDGATTDGWRGIGKDAFPGKGWDIVDGCLHHLPKGGGGDLVTTTEFGDFELEFEWRVAEGANSGVKYRVRDEPGTGSAFGPEYQVLDDANHSNGKNALTSAGSLYAVAAPAKTEGLLKPVGEFNHARIVARGERLEHWINGTRVVDIALDSDAWAKAVGASKFASRADFASAGPGRIALQDHSDEVWYRNLRIRELPTGYGEEVALYDGDLDAFIEYGDAVYTADDDAILGEVGGGGQSFLISKQHFGDFVFEVDVKTELPGNSGIQIRSHAKENGRPFGYQVEIDPSDRAWSGGLYDEARRGWLAPLEGNDAGRAAFRHGEWNRFRIETLGPWFRVRVNGVVTTHHFDTYDLEGFLALQVHSGNNTKVRWGSPRLWTRGTRAWVPAGRWTVHSGRGSFTSDRWSATSPDGPAVAGLAELTEPPSGVPDPSGDLALRVEFRATRGRFAVQLFAPEGDESTGPPPAAWLVDPMSSPELKPNDWNVLGVGLIDGELTANVNGRPLAIDGAAQVAGQRTRLRLWALGETEDAPHEVELRGLGLLGEAR